MSKPTHLNMKCFKLIVVFLYTQHRFLDGRFLLKNHVLLYTYIEKPSIYMMPATHFACKFLAFAFLRLTVPPTDFWTQYIISPDCCWSWLLHQLNQRHVCLLHSPVWGNGAACVPLHQLPYPGLGGCNSGPLSCDTAGRETTRCFMRLHSGQPTPAELALHKVVTILTPSKSKWSL